MADSLAGEKMTARAARARAAQAGWAARPLAERLRVVRRLRGLVAERSEDLVAAIGDRYGRTPAETLAAELIPFADACRFLEREAPRLLGARRLGRRGRPLWLWGAAAELRREPLGLVLIVAPGNYRLLLGGVQLVQALVAGNAALVKPAPGAGAPMALLAELLEEAGAPAGLVQTLDEDLETGKRALGAGVDKVVLTGSAATGRAVLAALAPQLVPAVMELSGSDAVFVLPGADLDATAKALVWGLQLNGGATCIAPRRVFVTERDAPALEAALAARLAAAPARPVDPGRAREAAAMAAEAAARGLRLLPAAPDGEAAAMRPTVAVGADPDLRLMREDPFAPLAALVPVPDMEAALVLAARSPYALGAAIFGPEREALALSGRVRAGVVTINDLIAPTADPRLPFGGRGDSGFGLTRGGEGLLEMTALKAVVLRKGRARPHWAKGTEADAALFAGFLLAAHGEGIGRRLEGARRLLRAGARRG